LSRRRQKPPPATRGETNKRVTQAEVEAMFEAYCEDPSAKYVSAKTGISYNTVCKYVSKGDPKRHIRPIRERHLTFMAGYRKRTEEDTRKILKGRRAQTTQLVNAFFNQFRQEIGGEQTITVPDDWKDNPKNWIAMVEGEIKMRQMERLEDAMDDRGPVKYIVELSDPAMQQALERQIRRHSERMAGAGIREVLKALSSNPKYKDVLDDLPFPIQVICSVDPADPDYKQEIRLLTDRIARLERADWITEVGRAVDAEDDSEDDSEGDEPDQEPVTGSQTAVRDPGLENE
jgi:hypothetical protein